MKAWRKINGVITEITVDVSPSGKPLLPTNATVQPKPVVLEGHYLDLVNGEWEQFPVQVIPEETFEQRKQKALKSLQAYKLWVLEQPVTVNGVKFDADETARARFIGAITAHGIDGTLPNAWVTYDNTIYPINTVADLEALSIALYNEFNDRFFYTTALRETILAAQDDAALEALDMPVIGFLPGEEIPEDYFSGMI